MVALELNVERARMYHCIMPQMHSKYAIYCVWENWQSSLLSHIHYRYISNWLSDRNRKITERINVRLER